MNELSSTVKELHNEVLAAMHAIGYDSLLKELEEKTAASQAPDFWDYASSAQEHMQALSKLQSRVEPWQKLHAQVNDLAELAALEDESLLHDLETQTNILKARFYVLKKELQFAGP